MGILDLLREQAARGGYGMPWQYPLTPQQRIDQGFSQSFGVPQTPQQRIDSGFSALNPWMAGVSPSPGGQFSPPDMSPNERVSQGFGALPEESSGILPGMPVSLAAPNPMSSAPGQRPQDLPWNNQGAPGLNGDVLLALAGGFLSGNPGAGFTPAAQISARERELATRRGEENTTQKALYEAALKAGANTTQALAYARSPTETLALTPKPVETGTDVFGQKFFAQPQPFTGQLKPMTGTGGGGAGGALGGAVNPGALAPGVAKYDPTLSGDEYLNQFSPDYKAAIKSYINGDAIPTGNPRIQSIWNQAKLFAKTYGDNTGIPINEGTYAAKRNMQLELTKSNQGSMGGILSNGASTLGHLGNLSDSMVALDNYKGSDVPGGGRVGQAQNLFKNVIAPTPETLGAINKVNGQALKYGEESTKFYSATGGGVQERTAALKTAKSNTAVGSEQAGFLEGELELLQTRLAEKERQVMNSGLPDEVLKKHLPSQNPVVQAEIAKIKNNIAILRGQAQGQEKTAPASEVPAPAIDMLKKNPSLADQFDAKYGPGRARKILQQ